MTETHRERGSERVWVKREGAAERGGGGASQRRTGKSGRKGGPLFPCVLDQAQRRQREGAGAGTNGGGGQRGCENEWGAAAPAAACKSIQARRSELEFESI